MKPYIQYIFLWLLVLLLHNGVATPDNNIPSPTSQGDTECCFISKAPSTAQQAIQEFYRQLNSLTLCLDHSDHKRVPDSKYIELWSKFMLVEGGSDTPEWHQTSQSTSHPCAYPQDYYIFELRKIVI